MFKSSIIIIILAFSLNGFSQEKQLTADSLSIHSHIGLLGRWQTGNLNQISLMPTGSISMAKPSYYANVNASYHFLRVNGFDVINDFWANGLFQYKPANSIYPSFHTTVGFASSYLIDHSSLTGVGLGANIHQKKRSYLQAHLFTAYLNFKYQEESPHTALGLGSLIRANIPINGQVMLHWVFSTYHSTKEPGFWGGGNLFRLNIMLLKSLSLNITHQSYYNNKTATTIKNTNTEMLFGIQYNFSNN